MALNEISWTDDDGAATLSNGKLDPGTRFANWVVQKRPVGPQVVGLGTGAIHGFEFRADTFVSFEIIGVPESEMAKMVRLQNHLLCGESVALTSERELASDFATCVLAPDADPEIQQTDATNREYSMSLVLLAVS